MNLFFLPLFKMICPALGTKSCVAGDKRTTNGNDETVRRRTIIFEDHTKNCCVWESTRWYAI